MEILLDLPLWPEAAPLGGMAHPADMPVLDAYLPDPARATGYGMLSLPGGGYTFLSEKSGREYGEWFAARGVAVFVVKFRLGSRGHDFRAKCADLFAAQALVRSRAAQWGVDPARLGVIGTSAGAHLAGVMCAAAEPGPVRERLAHAGVLAQVPGAAAPAFAVLCYGVLDLTEPLAHKETRANFLGALQADAQARIDFSPRLQASPRWPRCFVWHTAEDTEVPVEHSLLMAQRLRECGVPHELHLYQKGAHALGLALREGLHWAEDCLRWIVADA
ncbi:alpha/beta hydrolase [Azohydromonas australica]|uniref:alpha/beta hydrolase n=1 Tax=Azohydromonas australica TaxID=364039 RepID=UPI000412D159|nr:alpha/beta hydrolase [Azohydromonas australica]